jgi:hypothetical protein
MQNYSNQLIIFYNYFNKRNKETKYPMFFIIITRYNLTGIEEKNVKTLLKINVKKKF